MGASLAKVVLSARWSHLPAAARIVFAHMAITAKDDGTPPLYFGGRDALVLALDGDLAADEAERETQYRRLRRALGEIKRAGGIRPRNSAHTRQRAEYELVVLPRLAVTERPPVEQAEEVTERPPEEVAERPPVIPRGGHWVVKEEVTERPPKEDEEDVTAGLTRGLMTRAAREPHLGRGDCPTCGRSRLMCDQAGKNAGPGRGCPPWGRELGGVA